MRPRNFLGAHYKNMIRSEEEIVVTSSFFFKNKYIPLIDTWGPNTTRDPKNKNKKKHKKVLVAHVTSFETAYHTKSGDKSAYHKRCPAGIELQANAKTEDQARCDNPPFTTNHISHREREKCAKESSSRENRYLSSYKKEKVKNTSDERRNGGEETTNHKTFAVDWEVMVGSSKICW